MTKPIVSKTIIFAIALAYFTSCQMPERSETKSETNTTIEKDTVAQPNTIDSKLVITNFTPKNLHKQAGFEQLSPQSGSKLKAGDITFAFNTQKFPFVDGHSVKLAVENGTEKFVFDANNKVTLPAGTFLCAAYLCDGNGIALKNSKSFQLTQLNIDTDEKKEIDLNQPMIFLNLPTAREGKNALLDFMLFNTKLSKNGNKVRVSIDNKTEMYLDEWKTLKISGLSKGKHKILVELINIKGQLYDGVYANDNVDFEVQ